MSIHAQTNDIRTKEHHAGWSTVVSFTKKIGSLIVDAWMNTIVFSYSLVYQLTNLLPWERAIRVEAKATRSRHSAMDQYRMSIFLSFLLTTASGSRRNTTTSTNTSCRENGLIDCRLQSKHFGERTVAVNTVFFQLLLICGLLAQWWHSLKVTLVSRALIGNDAHRYWWICLKHVD